MVREREGERTEEGGGIYAKSKTRWGEKVKVRGWNKK